MVRLIRSSVAKPAKSYIMDFIEKPSWFCQKLSNSRVDQGLIL
jgi:hypothetical protein